MQIIERDKITNLYTILKIKMNAHTHDLHTMMGSFSTTQDTVFLSQAYNHLTLPQSADVSTADLLKNIKLLHINILFIFSPEAHRDQQLKTIILAPWCTRPTTYNLLRLEKYFMGPIANDEMKEKTQHVFVRAHLTP